MNATDSSADGRPSEQTPAAPSMYSLGGYEHDQPETKRRREESSKASSVPAQWSTPDASGSRTGPRKKAVARPEEPGGVEDVCYAEILLTVPTELFKLEGLQTVLNMATWEECLTDGEREYLQQFLPDAEDPKELLTALLDGETNFCFGNPLSQIWELMKQGECHPRVAKYREALRCLQHCQHYHNVKDYHNNMVVTLRQMAQDGPEVPLQQRIQKWNAVFRERPAHLGRDSRRSRRKN